MNIRPGMTLAERSARSGLSAPPAPARPKHCWVVDSALSPGRWPGVLLGWRRQPGGRGWQGLAVWVADDDDGQVLLQAWVPADHLHAVPGAGG